MKRTLLRKANETNLSSHNSLNSSMYNASTCVNDNTNQLRDNFKFVEASIQNKNKNFESNINSNDKEIKTRSNRANSISLVFLENIFNKLDYDKDSLITHDDLENFKNSSRDKYKICNQNEIMDLSAFDRKINEVGKGIDLPEFIKSFREGMKICKIFINLFRTKLNAINSSIERYLSEINFEDLHLVCEYFSGDKTLDYPQQIIPISSHKNKILIEKIGYEFDLEKYFLNLFSNNDCEFIKEVYLNSDNSEKLSPQLSGIKIRLELNLDISQRSKERLNKIKSRFSYYLEKIQKVETERNKYEEIETRLNTRNNSDSQIDHEEKYILVCLRHISVLLSLKEDDDVSCLNQSVNESSFLSNSGKFHSSALLRGAKCFDSKDCESSHSLRDSINYFEQHLSARNSLSEAGLKYPQYTSSNPQDHHNHNHIHIHNHIHSFNTNESQYVSANSTPKITEETYINEKIITLMNIFKTESKEKADKAQENAQNDGKGNSRPNKKSFSLTTLLHVSTQINSMLLLNKEFNVCSTYFNLCEKIPH